MLYLDGALVATGPSIPGVRLNTLSLRIGAMHAKEVLGVDDRFEGLIDEVEIFDWALSAAEIRAIFDAGNSGKRKPSGIAPPAGMVSWWPGDGNHGTLSGDATFAQGLVGQAFSFDGVDDFVFVPASNSLNVASGSGITIDAWINSPDITLAGPLVEWNDEALFGVHFWTSVPLPAGTGPASLFANIRDTALNNRIISSAPGVLTSNTFEHVAVTYDKTTGFSTLYLNGEVVATADLGIFTPSTNFDLYFGSRPSGGGIFYQGIIDEIEIFDRALSQAEIRAIFEAGSAGKRKP